MILPFWNSELYVEISSWFPFGRDYHPVSLNRFYSGTLKNISESCIDLGGEFFFMASPSTGCVGNLSRENFFKYSPDMILNLGFLMTLGYSENLEKAVIASMILPESEMKLSAGITACSLWSHGIFEGVTKVIAVASDEPFFDGTKYLEGLAKILNDFKKFLKSGDNYYYAEKFGYNRFFMQWEDDNPIDIAVSRILTEFEFEGTKKIVGGSPVTNFPPFMGAALSLMSAPVVEE